MDKEIIIYYSAAHRTDVVIMNALLNGFRELGCAARLVDCRDLGAVGQAAQLIVGGQALFSVGMNTDGLNFSLANDKYLYEDADLLHISILSDAPYNLGIPDIERCCKNHAVCYLDRSHLQCFDYVFPAKKWAGRAFMPFGGVQALPETDIFSSKRPFEVVYSANFWQLPQRSWREQNIDVSLVRLLDEIGDVLTAEPLSVYDAAGRVLAAHGLLGKAWLGRLYPYFWHLFAFIKNYRRLKCLELLTSNAIQVDVFGAGWEQVPFADKLRLHGRISYEDNLRLMTQAKIVYQDQAEFNNGAHDRVFTAMLNGAVVVSEYSSYLAEEFTAGQELYMYDWQNGVQQVQVINELLNDEPRRLAMALKAYSKAAKKHRWQNRAERLLEMAALCRAEREKL